MCLIKIIPVILQGRLLDTRGSLDRAVEKWRELGPVSPVRRWHNWGALLDSNSEARNILITPHRTPTSETLACLETDSLSARIPTETGVPRHRNTQNPDQRTEQLVPQGGQRFWLNFIGHGPPVSCNTSWTNAKTLSLSGAAMGI
jgi:hypothetical protein